MTDRPPIARVIRLTQPQLDAMARHLFSIDQRRFPGVTIPIPPISTFGIMDGRQNYMLSADTLNRDSGIRHWAEAVAKLVSDPRYAAHFIDFANPEQSLRRLAAAAGRNPDAGPLGVAVINAYREQLKSGASKEQAFGHAMTTMLQDPVFLYRNETPFEGVTSTDGLQGRPRTTGRLSDVRYLEYLSFALADTSPAALGLDPAKARDYVGTPEATRETIARIQASPAGRGKLADFFRTWALIPEKAADFQVDQSAAPQYTEAVGREMLIQARQFLQERLSPPITKAYFAGRTVSAGNSTLAITPEISEQIHQHLVRNNYLNEDGTLSGNYMVARASGSFVPLPAALAPYTPQILALMPTNPTLASVVQDHRHPVSSPLAFLYTDPKTRLVNYEGKAGGLFGLPASITAIDRGRNDEWGNGYIQRSMFLARTVLGFPFTGIPEDVARELAAKSKITEEHFAGKKVTAGTNTLEITPAISRQIHQYLVQNQYLDENGALGGNYVIAKDGGSFAPLPAALAPYAPQIMALIDTAAKPAYDPQGFKDQGDFIETITAGNENCSSCHAAANPIGRAFMRIGAMAGLRIAYANGDAINTRTSFPVEAFGYTNVKAGDMISGLVVKKFEGIDGLYVQPANPNEAMRFLTETPFFRAKAAERMYTFYNLHEPTRDQLSLVTGAYDRLAQTQAMGGDLLGAMGMLLPREREHDPARSHEAAQFLYSPHILERHAQLYPARTRATPAGPLPEEIQRMQDLLRDVPAPRSPFFGKKSEMTPVESIPGLTTRVSEATSPEIKPVAWRPNGSDAYFDRLIAERFAPEELKLALAVKEATNEDPQDGPAQTPTRQSTETEEQVRTA